MHATLGAVHAESSQDTVSEDEIGKVRFRAVFLFDNYFKVFKFFCKNSISLTLSHSKRVRFSVTIFLAAENKRSIMVFEAGMAQIISANRDNLGKEC